MDKYRTYGIFLLLLSYSKAQESSVCNQLFSNCKCQNGNQIVVCSELNGFRSFPRPLPEEIVNLTVTDSFLGDIEPSYTDFGKYKNLKNIIIKSSRIRYLQACAISNLNGIDSLLLDNVRIEKIATNAFSHLTNITTFKVENSEIFEIMKFAFHDISNMKTFRISNLTVDKFDTSSVRDLYNITSFEMKNSRIEKVAYAPIQNIIHVGRMQFSNNTITTAFCGLADISPTNNINTLRDVEFIGNRFACFKNVTMAIRALSDQWTMSDNVCDAPDFLRGAKLEDLSSNNAYLTRSDELPTCGNQVLTYDDHSCQSYKIDQGILAPEDDYIDNGGPKDGCSTVHSTGVYLLFTLMACLSTLYM